MDTAICNTVLYIVFYYHVNDMLLPYNLCTVYDLHIKYVSSHQNFGLDMSMDESFSEMTYTDTNTKEEYNCRLANEKENFATFINKV